MDTNNNLKTCQSLPRRTIQKDMEVQNLLPVICFVSLGNSWRRDIINMIITLTPTERKELGYFSHPNKKGSLKGIKLRRP
jgi:hypothetical protein